MIIDLDEYVKPVLHICDAIVGMEGNGPTAGTPRPVGCLVASASPHQLDLVCAALVGLGRSDVPTLEAAYERQMIPATVDELTVSDGWRDFIVPDYQRIQGQSSLLFRGRGGLLGRVGGAVIQAAVCPRPTVKPSVCVGCGECSHVCPAKAITMKNKLPVIDRRACIRCFCCQEFCPKGAMVQHRPLAARILNP